MHTTAAAPTSSSTRQQRQQQHPTHQHQHPLVKEPTSSTSHQHPSAASTHLGCVPIRDDLVASVQQHDVPHHHVCVGDGQLVPAADDLHLDDVLLGIQLLELTVLVPVVEGACRQQGSGWWQL
jgi:hypothetical protein